MNLPRPPEELPIIVLEAPGENNKGITFKANRYNILRGLQKLKEINPCYKDLEINMNNLNKYPESYDVPISGIRTMEVVDNKPLEKLAESIVQNNPKDFKVIDQVFHDEEVAEIEEEARARPSQHLMVGFNRRFAPLVVKAKTLLDTISVPKNLIMTVNAGEIPSDHWTQDPEIGGGRIIGEGCHFIDLLRHLAGAAIVRSHVIALGAHDALPVRDDKVVITIEFSDGSVGVINYLANGLKAVPKERLEIFAAGRILQIDNFLRFKAYGWPGIKSVRSWKQDKGQNACPAAFVKAIKTGAATPIPLAEVIESSRVSIELAGSI